MEAQKNVGLTKVIAIFTINGILAEMYVTGAVDSEKSHIGFILNQLSSDATSPQDALDAAYHVKSLRYDYH